MNSFKNPLVPVIVNPVNIDTPIQELQIALASLTWLERSFGRTWTAYRNDVNGKQILYPETWQGLGKDLLNVMPNDNLNSQSFFKVEDPIEVIDYSQNHYNRMRARVSVIFWFNLERIDPTLDYRFIEILKAQAQRVITDFNFTSNSYINILRTWEEADNVFRGYTIDKVKNQELVHPYAGFRFECDLVYLENCPSPLLP